MKHECKFEMVPISTLAQNIRRRIFAESFPRGHPVLGIVLGLLYFLLENDFQRLVDVLQHRKGLRVHGEVVKGHAHTLSPLNLFEYWDLRVPLEQKMSWSNRSSPTTGERS